jgi:ATP-dependent Lon protease
MMDTLERIPLFPLGVILFPGARVPLHIFEERYKRLCATTLEKKSTFGINFTEDDNMHSVGCTARIAEVTKRYPDGKLDIVTEGVRRFEVVTLDQNEPSEIPYAKIRWIDDVPEVRDEAIAAKAIGLFNELCEVAYKGSVEPLDPVVYAMPDKEPSFAIAQKSGLLPDQRQTLLLVTSENERLEMLVAHLESLLPKVKEVETINDLIRNDGYIPTWNKRED